MRTMLTVPETEKSRLRDSSADSDGWGCQRLWDRTWQVDGEIYVSLELRGELRSGVTLCQEDLLRGYGKWRRHSLEENINAEGLVDHSLHVPRGASNHK